MGKNVRVNLFEVTMSAQTQRLSDTLDEYAALPLGDRWRDGIRLEKVTRFAADNVLPLEVFHLELSKERAIGPGRMSSDQPLQDVNLGNGELFGEETTALYVPKNRWLLVLNNQYGVGPARMAAYFNALDPGNLLRHFDYVIQPMIDKDALKKMQKMQRFSEVEITASVGIFGGAEDAVATSVSQAASGISAQRLTLKLMANEKHKRGGSLNIPALNHLLKKLLPQSENIDRLVVKGDGETVATKDKMVDLLMHKVSAIHPQSSLQITGHRYTHGSKIDLLRRTCRGWLNKLE